MTTDLGEVDLALGGAVADRHGVLRSSSSLPGPNERHVRFTAA